MIAAGALVLVRSDFGLVMRAIRDNERRVRFFGTNVEAVKIAVFVLGAVLAALGGGVYATIVGFVSAPQFGFLFSTQILIWVAVGGRGTIIGADRRRDRPELRHVEAERVVPDRVGALPRAAVRRGGGVRPGRGAAAARPRWGAGCSTGAGRRGVSRALVASPPARPALRPRGEPICVVSEIEFAYGALQVLRGVDFDIRAGELLCIVGPNGAGKSTMLNVLTDGKLPGARVDLVLPPRRRGGAEGEADPSDRPLRRRAEVPDPSPLRQPHRRGDDPARAPARGGSRRCGARTKEVPVGQSVRDIVERDGLDGREDTLSPALAHGLKQGLELAAAVSMRPELLLLDEPTAGLTSNERHVIGDVFRRLVDAGMTIVLIEHDLDFVAASPTA